MSCTPFRLKGTAKELYEQHALKAPIYDYHCHLSPREIYENKVFSNVSSVLLDGDHYKWRAMRYYGEQERDITGEGEPFDRFLAWARTCERLPGSPLAHWSRLEMRTFFGVDEPLQTANAKQIYKICNGKIESQQLSPQKLMDRMNVRLVCTTDDPADSLQYHTTMAEEGKPGCRVLPTFRPDKALNAEAPGYAEYVAKLGKAAGKPIRDIRGLEAALLARLAFFARCGCRFSDHSLESLEWKTIDAATANQIFQKAIGGQALPRWECDSLKLYLLVKLAPAYQKHDIAMQLHIGALRNVNSKAYGILGADAGYDVPNDFEVARPIATFLDALEETGGLPRTLLYALNLKDYNALAALCPCYTQVGTAAKVQLGPAWWHADTKAGMLRQLTVITEYGLLSGFWGMLTDSRSFLSYTRHHYFRMILCDYLGALYDGGDLCIPKAGLIDLVNGICFKNVEAFL